MTLRIKTNIATLQPYAPPWTGINRREYLRLDLNENTMPPPVVVQHALRALVEDGALQMYPEYGWFYPTLSRYTGVPEAQSMVTNGSDQAIEIVLRTFLGPGDGIVIARPEFPIFFQVAQVIGATMQGVPYTSDLTFPLEHFMQTVDENTRLIAIINPNNPTGSSVSLKEIEHILKRYSDLPVVVDEAYFEFTGVTAVPFLKSYPNLIVTRTFSKAFAMAGLRLGYILAHPDLIAAFHKVRGPFDVNTCALHAAAAQLGAPSDWRQYVEEVTLVSRPFIENYFVQRHVDFFPGAANFMLVRPSHKDDAVHYLKKQGILVRPMLAPSIQNMFRLSIGNIEQMERFVEVFDDFLKKSGHSF